MTAQDAVAVAQGEGTVRGIIRARRKSLLMRSKVAEAHLTFVFSQSMIRSAI